MKMFEYLCLRFRWRTKSLPYKTSQRAFFIAGLSWTQISFVLELIWVFEVAKEARMEERTTFKAVLARKEKEIHVRLSRSNWRHCSFFGVYDGHGGRACAEHVREYAFCGLQLIFGLLVVLVWVAMLRSQRVAPGTCTWTLSTASMRRVDSIAPARSTTTSASDRPRGHDTPLFPRLVLGCINTDFCVQILIFQHFSRSIKSSSWIFRNFQKTNFWKF